MFHLTLLTKKNGGGWSYSLEKNNISKRGILLKGVRQKFGNLDISESGLRRPSIQNQAENERLSMRNTLKNNSILQI